MTPPIRRESYVLIKDTGPLIVSEPHVGTKLPAELDAEFTDIAHAVPDTDWHVDRLYDFVGELNASQLQAMYSRYVIDLNRPADDASLYPGMTKTGLCPTQSFNAEALYRDARESLSPRETQRRLQNYWLPYHRALQELIAATRARHGYALLLDAHSIRSRVPRLFAGVLPHINVGTADGRACSRKLRSLLQDALASQTGFTHVFDGRFKGGYITRHYGEPNTNVHAFQIELTQASYMDEDSCSYDWQRAAPLRNLLRTLLQAVCQFKP